MVELGEGRRGMVSGGTPRTVRLLWTGNLAFMSAFFCPTGATARFPCVFFPAAIRPGPLHAELIAKYGVLQRAEVPPPKLCTRRELLHAMDSYRTCDDDVLELLLSSWQHL